MSVQCDSELGSKAVWVCVHLYVRYVCHGWQRYVMSCAALNDFPQDTMKMENDTGDAALGK